MTTLMVCKFNLVYKQKTEARKVKIMGGALILAPRKNLKPEIKEISDLLIPYNTLFSFFQA